MESRNSTLKMLILVQVYSEAAIQTWTIQCHVEMFMYVHTHVHVYIYICRVSSIFTLQNFFHFHFFLVPIQACPCTHTAISALGI